MFSNLNKIVIFLLLSVFFVVLQENYVWAAEQCEIITVDKSRPILKKKLTLSERKAYLASIPKVFLTERK